MKRNSPPSERLLPSDRAHAEELANTITHAAGLVLSVSGALVMTWVVLARGDAWRATGCGLYLASLVAVYAMSTMSHLYRTPARKHFFRRLDQGFIYLFIAATYTPFSLAYLRTGPWWLLLGAIWAVALYGFVSKVFFAHRVESVAVWPCVLLGWMPIVAAPSLLEMVSTAALMWMLLGGVCYSIGLVFLVNDQRMRHFHAVWHLFVIAGSTCHFLAILLFVAAVQ
jgi:hemolysin III